MRNPMKLIRYTLLINDTSMRTSICIPKLSLSQNVVNERSIHHPAGYSGFQISMNNSNSAFLCCKSMVANKFSTSPFLAKSKDRGKDKKKSGETQQVDMNELAQVIDAEKLVSQFERAIDQMKDNFVKVLSLRSTTGAIEDLKITYEGQDYTLQELVQISRKPKLIILNVSSFPQVLTQIMECLQKSGMNLNPQQDGTTIYIPIPKVTKEHRETLAKSAKAMFNKCKDNIKDVQNSFIKALKNDTSCDKETFFRVQGYIQALAAQYVKKAEEVLAAKQKELLGAGD